MRSITKALFILPIHPVIAACASARPSKPNLFKEQLAILQNKGNIVRRQE